MRYPPAGRRVKDLVFEAVQLNSCMSICNPTGIHTFNCSRLEGDAEAQAPPKEFWQNIMVRPGPGAVFRSFVRVGAGAVYILSLEGIVHRGGKAP